MIEKLFLFKTIEQICFFLLILFFYCHKLTKSTMLRTLAEVWSFKTGRTTCFSKFFRKKVYENNNSKKNRLKFNVCRAWLSMVVCLLETRTGFSIQLQMVAYARYFPALALCFLVNFNSLNSELNKVNIIHNLFNVCRFARCLFIIYVSKASCVPGTTWWRGKKIENLFKRWCMMTLFFIVDVNNSRIWDKLFLARIMCDRTHELKKNRKRSQSITSTQQVFVLNVATIFTSILVSLSRSICFYS